MSIFGMLRLVSLTRKRFAFGQFRSFDEWMFGVSFRQPVFVQVKANSFVKADFPGTQGPIYSQQPSARSTTEQPF
jgi:hypothetical protein